MRLTKKEARSLVKEVDSAKLTERLKALKGKNSRWQKQYKRLQFKTFKAKKHEKAKEYQQAINQYLNAISYSEKEFGNISYIAHSIHRVIILYGKLKLKGKLRNYLESVITKYPNYRDCEDWKNRLSKIQ